MQTNYDGLMLTKYSKESGVMLPHTAWSASKPYSDHIALLDYLYVFPLHACARVW